MKKLRVLLVDDEIMIREGFKRLFDWEAHDCQVIGEAADGMCLSCRWCMSSFGKGNMMPIGKHYFWVHWALLSQHGYWSCWYTLSFWYLTIRSPEPLTAAHRSMFCMGLPWQGYLRKLADGSYLQFSARNWIGGRMPSCMTLVMAE